MVLSSEAYGWSKYECELYTLRNPFFWDLRLQHEMINSHLSSTFPSLVRVAFSAFVIWERTSSDSPWRAFIPHIHRETVAKNLRDTEFTVFGDCYHHLLTLVYHRDKGIKERVPTTSAA